MGKFKAQLLVSKLNFASQVFYQNLCFISTYYK